MFEIFINFFNIVLYQPLFNVLVLFYEYLPGHDFGIAVIILTILTKVIFYPLGAQAIKSQKAMSELQPKMKEIKEKYKNDKDKEMKATLELYKKEKINPLSGCLPMLIQFPILIALYRVFWRGLQPEAMAYLYSFVPNPGQINPIFLGIFNLAESSIILAVFAGILQFIQTKMTVPKTSISKSKGTDFSQMFQTQMVYFFPIFTIYILSPLSPWNLPSAIALYWVVTTLFSIGQQYTIFKK
jgi:YidC/Oxa1 family membrane protein insertase